jgi:uncharacterized iron-regulated membrane protein
METIVLALVIIALAGTAIWYYSRPVQDANNDVKHTRDQRDLELSLNSESAARAANAVEKTTRSRKSTAKKPAAKKPAVKATKPAARAAKPRTTKKSV